MHEHGAVGLDQQQPGGAGQVGGEPAGVVDRAVGDHEAHRTGYAGTPDPGGRSAVRAAWCKTRAEVVRIRPRTWAVASVSSRGAIHGARDQPVGVVGLGTMGAGIAEVFARSGLRRHRRRGRRGRVDRGRGHVEKSTARARRARQADRGGARRDPRPHPLHHRPRRPRRPRPGDRGRPRAARAQARDLRQLDKVVAAGRDPRHQHLLPVGHRHRRRHRRAPRGSSACTSSTRRRCCKFVEVVRTVVSDAGRRRRRRGPRRVARQAARRRRRQGRLHRQRAAVRLPQPRGLDVRDDATPRARTSTRR